MSEAARPPAAGGSMPPGQALLRGAGLVALFGLVAAAARLGLDATIAWRHGLGPEVDAYLFLTNLVNWPVAVALSCLTLLVAPVEASLAPQGPAALARFRAELLGCALALSALALPLAGVGLLVLSGSGAAGLSPAARAVAQDGAWALAPSLSLGLLVALLSAWMVAAARHGLALVEALPALLLAALVVSVPGVALFWGTTAGLALQLLVLTYLLRRARIVVAPRWRLSSPAWSRFGRGSLALLAAQAMFALMPLIDQFFAARLGEGTLAALGLANRLLLGLQGLGALALQRAALPLLSRFEAGEAGAAARAVLPWAVAAAAAGAVLAAVAALFADPLVAVLYERGSFTASHREAVAELLRWGLLQLPPYLAGGLLVVAAASALGSASIAQAAACGVVVKLVASAALVPALGAVGLQVATALTYLATTCWLALASLRRARLVGR